MAVTQNIHAIVSNLRKIIDTMPKFPSPYLVTLEHSLHLYLCLVWPPIQDDNINTLRVQQLLESLEEPRIRLCAAAHLMVWQLFVGTMSAENPSATRRWFALRLKRLLESMRVDSWQRLLAVFKKTFKPDVRLLVEFELLWKEACK